MLCDEKFKVVVINYNDYNLIKNMASNFFQQHFEMDFHYLSGPVPKHIVLNRSMKIIL